MDLNVPMRKIELVIYHLPDKYGLNNQWKVIWIRDNCLMDFISGAKLPYIVRVYKWSIARLIFVKVTGKIQVFLNPSIVASDFVIQAVSQKPVDLTDQTFCDNCCKIVRVDKYGFIIPTECSRMGCYLKTKSKS